MLNIPPENQKKAEKSKRSHGSSLSTEKITSAKCPCQSLFIYIF